MFWFSQQLLCETFLILRTIQQNIIIKVQTVFMWSTFRSSWILIKLEFSWKILKKYSNTKFNENLSSPVSAVVPCEQMDRQRSMMKLTVVFCNFADVPNKFRIIKPTRCTHFSILFWNETCRVSFQKKIEKLVYLVGFIIQNLSWCMVTWTLKVPNKVFRFKMNDKIQMQTIRTDTSLRASYWASYFLIPLLLLTQTVFDKSAIFMDTNYFSFYVVTPHTDRNSNQRQWTVAIIKLRPILAKHPTISAFSHTTSAV